MVDGSAIRARNNNSVLLETAGILRQTLNIHL